MLCIAKLHISRLPNEQFHFLNTIPVIKNRIRIMKIVLTGSTGFIGSEVLQQCIQSQDIDSIVVLTRRPLSTAANSPKVNNIIIEDFESYHTQTTDAVSNADACIWLVVAQTDQS